MTRPDGSLVTAPAKTDENGRFSAVFDLAQKGKKAGRPQIKGTIYAFQAHIINATQLAPADSNIIWYRLGDRDNEQQPTDDRSDDERQSSERNPPSLK
jgi:hypothetical protein